MSLVCVQVNLKPMKRCKMKSESVEDMPKIATARVFGPGKVARRSANIEIDATMFRNRCHTGSS